MYVRRVGILLSFILTCLTGCESGGHFTLLGYTTTPTFDPGIRTVYVPIAKNVSYLKDIEFDLTQMVIRELGQRSGAPRVTSDRNRADTELELRIVRTTKSTIIINQLGETRDSELGVDVEVVWRDLRPGRCGDILSNRKRFDPNELPLPGDIRPVAPAAVPLLISPTAQYAPELGGSNTTANRQAVTKAAQQIVNMMEVWR